MSHRRFLLLIVACTIRVLTSHAQDSSLVRLNKVADELHGKRILSDPGRAQLYQWTAQLTRNDGSWGDDEERFRAKFMELADRNYEAKERISCFQFWADSLRRAGHHSIKGLTPEERNVQLAKDVLYHCDLDHQTTSATKQDLSWAFVYDSFRYAHDALVQDTSLLYPGLADRFADPTILLEALNASGALDGPLHPVLQRHIACGKVRDAASLFQWAASEMHGRQYTRTNAEIVHRVMSAGFCPEVDGRRILDRIEAYGALDRSDLVASCAPTIIVPYDARDASVDVLYRHALDRAGSLHPELRPTAIRIQRTKVESKGFSADSLVHVEFDIDGRPYGFRAFEGPLTRRQEPRYDALIEALNKALCDQRSPHRLFSFLHWKEECDAYYPDSIRIALFHVEQCALWWPSPVDALQEHRATGSCDLSFSTTFCRENIQGMVDRFRTAGVLSHLTPEQIDQATVKANMTMHEDWAEVLGFFPDVLYDPPYFHEDGPTGLEEILRSLSRVSHGAFNPTDIKVRGRGGGYDRRLHVSYRLAGKRRRERLPFRSNTSSVVEFVDRTLAEDHHLGRFCLMDKENSRSVLYLDQHQFKALVDPYLSRYFGDPWQVVLPKTRWP